MILYERKTLINFNRLWKTRPWNKGACQTLHATKDIGLGHEEITINLIRI